MYAAAGGASLASRQKQRQQKTRQQRALRAAEPAPRQPQAKQFHNYTEDAAAPRLSRVERGALRPPQAAHERRHSTSNYHLKEIHGRARIRESPSISIPVQPDHAHHHAPHHHPPPTQPPSPVTLTAPQLPQIDVGDGGGAVGGLERRCSFVRQVEEMGRGGADDVLDRCNHICNFEIKEQRWEEAEPAVGVGYCYDEEAFGSLEYPFSECSQGRAAWEERERRGLRRCSLSEEARQLRLKQNEAHHRWMKRNRIRDASAYGPGGYGADYDLDPFSAYRQSAAANALLYVGLGATALGAVIFFVGTGEKGFQTVELRMIGPTLVACGLLCCLTRVLLCACPVPKCCMEKRRGKSFRERGECPHARYPLAPHRRSDYDDTIPGVSGMHRHKKKVSIVPPATAQAQEEAEAAPQQQQQLLVSIPQINLPGDSSTSDNAAPGAPPRDDSSIIELQDLDLAYDDDSEASDDAGDAPAYLGVAAAYERDECLTVVVERDAKKDERDRHSGIVLSPLQLGQ